MQNLNQKELFDNEHTKYRKVKMGDVEALLGEDKNTGYYLVWEDEGITHTIIGRISIRELMLVAQKFTEVNCKTKGHAKFVRKHSFCMTFCLKKQT